MLSSQKEKFSLPEDIHYLNCAYMSPMLRSAEEAGKRALEMKRDPSKIVASDFFVTCKELRAEFSKLIGNKDENQIAIIPSVSYGLTNAANNIDLGANDEILLTGEQFPSNVYVWMQRAKDSGAKIVTVDAPSENENRGQKWNERIIDAINPSTKVVAMGNVHWTDGTYFDLESISKRVREVDAYLIVDGSQSVGALPFDVEKIQPDALICAGYKWLLSNYGVGLAYYGERFNDGTPMEQNWIVRRDSEDFAGLVNYQENYQPGAIRYDVGERSNFISVDIQLTALRQLNDWGINDIQQYAGGLMNQTIDRLAEFGYTAEEKEWRVGHVCGIRLSAGQDPKKIAQLLGEKNIFVSVRGSAVRISVNVFNTSDDLDALSECLKGAV